MNLMPFSSHMLDMLPMKYSMLHDFIFCGNGATFIFLFRYFCQCLSFSPSSSPNHLLGIAGRDFCVLACDTRLSDAYVIKSRNLSRIIEVETIFIFFFEFQHAII